MIFHPTLRPGMLSLVVSEDWVCFKLPLFEGSHGSIYIYRVPCPVQSELTSQLLRDI